MTKKNLDCIDLKRRFGAEFRIKYDQSYSAEHGHAGRKPDPWLMQIPCVHGHLFPYGGEVLGASTKHRGPIAKRLASLPCVTVVQDGDDGINGKFDVKHFEEVAAILKPKRRRRLSPEHRAKLIAAGKRNLVQHRRSNYAGDDLKHAPVIDSGLDRDSLLIGPLMKR